MHYTQLLECSLHLRHFMSSLTEDGRLVYVECSKSTMSLKMLSSDLKVTVQGFGRAKVESRYFSRSIVDKGV